MGKRRIEHLIEGDGLESNNIEAMFERPGRQHLAQRRR
jgi:hypothetical protein